MKKLFLVFNLLALCIAVALSAGLLYGVLFGGRQLNVHHVEIHFQQLPPQFDHFKIVQLSDIHLGSFNDTCFISKSVDSINSLNPDLVVMTGDMINILSSEAIPYIDIFKRIQSKYGKLAILGNHDISDYRKFDSIRAGRNDIAQLISIEEKMGFIVLMDSAITIHHENDSITIVGVNNWGLPPFKQKGNLKKALTFSASETFKVLLSHDPTHWKAQVLPDSDIALTLSGHTHGMQFGINTEMFKWSPSKYMYSENMGLYKEKDRYLYVNTGLGFIGYAGRLGIWPEISCITLLTDK